MIERRWGILWRRLEVRLANVPLVILTIVHLHNICMEFAVPEVDNSALPFAPLERDGEHQPGRRRDREATALRSELVEAVRAAGLHRP